MIYLLLAVLSLFVLLYTGYKNKQQDRFIKNKQLLNKFQHMFPAFKEGTTVRFNKKDVCGCESDDDFVGMVSNINVNPNYDDFSYSLVVAEVYDISNNKEYYMFPRSYNVECVGKPITKYEVCIFEKDRLPNINFTYKDLIDNGILGSSLDRIEIKEIL